MVATRAQSNPFLDRSVRRIGKLPLPTLLPKQFAVAITPLWLIVRPAAFALYTRALQLIWRLIPDRLLLVPLARNRLEYEKIVRLHRSVALESFAAPGGCPVG